MPHVPRLFCGCGCEMRPEKTGERVRVDLSNGEPYYLLSVDRWKCPECLSEARLSGLKQQPIREHFHPDFDPDDCDAVCRLRP